MRAIQKNLAVSAIPASLRLPYPAYFDGGKVPRQSKTTHQRRIDAIRQGSYEDNNANNSRYKLSDIKELLETIYLHKCAYCEQRIEQFQVEHYRPKSTYWWLAFSWDNLLAICPYCNQYKLDQFPTANPATPLDVSLATIRKINVLGADYDRIEAPLLVNPESTNPEGKLKFGKDGAVASDNHRFSKTIEICRLSRTYLRDSRFKILDDLRKDIESEIKLKQTSHDQEVAIKSLVRKFVREAFNPESEFTAFRKFVIQHWLAEETEKPTNINRY